MPLQMQPIVVPLARGVMTKTDVKMLQPGQNAALENCVLTTLERASKRNGYAALTTGIVGGGSIAAADSMLGFKNELLIGNGPSLYSYSPGEMGWINKGFIIPLVVGGKSIMRGTSQQTMADSATASGTTLYAWEDSRGGVRASVMDDTTGTVLQSDVSMNASGVTPRVVAFTTVSMVLYRVAGTIRCKIYNPSTNSFGGEVTVTADIDAGNGRFDAVQAGNNNIIAYCTTAGAGVKVAYLLNTGAFAGAGSGFPSAVTPAAENAANSICVNFDPSTNLTYVAYSTATPALRGFILNPDFTTKVAAKAIDATATIVRNITGVLDPSTANRILYFYEFNNATTYNAQTWTVTFNSAGTVGTPTILFRSLGLASKAWTQGSVAYVCAAYSTLLNATYFIVNSSGNVAGKILPTTGGGLTAKQNGLASVRSYGSGVYRFPVMAKVQLVSSGGNVFFVTGVWESSLNFGAQGNQQAVTLGDNLHVVGGSLYVYDGYGAVESGYYYPPENVTNVNSGGGSVDVGTHVYYVVFEWSDAQGQLHKSAPSLALSVTVSGGNQTVTLTIPTLRVTAKTAPRNEVNIVVYRTAANLQTPYRLTSITAPLANTTTADTVSYADTVADSTITSNEQLYTTPGAVAPVLPVLSNDAPPACTVMAVGKNRIFIDQAEANNVLWYSKARVPGQAVAFSQFQTITLPVLLGSDSNITALAVMDDKVIIFKRAAIMVFSGDGPDPTGANNFYSSPQIVTTDVGCTQPNSIVLMPLGLIFFSAKGWYLLNRSLQTSYIGADVEAFNTQTYVNATLVPYANQTRFLTSSGSTLVYDHYVGQWSTFTNHAGNDAQVVNGVYYYLRTNGVVYQETPGVFLDAGQYISIRIRTGWISFASINGFQRIWSGIVLGSYISGHSLLCRIAYDLEPYFTDVLQINASSVANATSWGSDTYWGQSSPYGGDGDNVEQFEIMPPRQKCSSIQFEFTDLGQGTTGEGLNLSALTLLVGMKRGLAKIPSSKRLN